MLKEVFRYLVIEPFRRKVHASAPNLVAPPLTEKMRSHGFHWVRVRYEDGSKGWHEACDTCGGNCGQCGTSLGRGLPASIGNIVKTTGMNSGRHAGLPRR